MVFVRVHVISSFLTVSLFYSTTACAMNAVYHSDHLKRCVVAEEKERGKREQRKGSRRRGKKNTEGSAPFVLFRVFPYLRLFQSKVKTLRSNTQLNHKQTGGLVRSLEQRQQSSQDEQRVFPNKEYRFQIQSQGACVEYCSKSVKQVLFSKTHTHTHTQSYINLATQHNAQRVSLLENSLMPFRIAQPSATHKVNIPDKGNRVLLSLLQWGPKEERRSVGKRCEKERKYKQVEVK